MKYSVFVNKDEQFEVFRYEDCCREREQGYWQGFFSGPYSYLGDVESGEKIRIMRCEGWDNVFVTSWKVIDFKKWAEKFYKDVEEDGECVFYVTDYKVDDVSERCIGLGDGGKIDLFDVVEEDYDDECFIIKK